jgi:hypothetical protein
MAAGQELNLKMQLRLALEGGHDSGPLFNPVAVKKKGTKGAVRRQNYDIRLKRATPKWLTEDQRREINDFYREARKLTIAGPDKWTVDHIVPLNGETVCGLHVPWNLEVLTRWANMSKGNKFIEQLGLFDGQGHLQV